MKDLKTLCSPSPTSSKPSSYIEETLSINIQQHSTLTISKGMCSKSFALQQADIDPNNRAGKDVARAVVQLKEYNAKIAKLS